MDGSYVTVSAARGTTSYVGEDGTRLAHAIVLRGAIRLYMQTGMTPTRGVTITRMLGQAEKFSGKRYKRGQGGQAVVDITSWIEAMKCAIPIMQEA